MHPSGHTPPIGTGGAQRSSLIVSYDQRDWNWDSIVSLARTRALPGGRARKTFPRGSERKIFLLDVQSCPLFISSFRYSVPALLVADHIVTLLCHLPLSPRQRKCPAGSNSTDPGKNTNPAPMCPRLPRYSVQGGLM